MKKVHVILITAMTVACSFISVGIINAEDTDQIKSYTYDEGIKVAKDTGKPILFSTGDLFSYHNDEINKIIGNDFIYIRLLITRTIYSSTHDIECIIPYMIMCYDYNDNLENSHVLVLDSNGREITRIIHSDDTYSFIQLDSDGIKITSINTSTLTAEEYVNFILETIEYSKTKKGKIQRLPQEKGLMGINDLSNVEDHLNFFTVSGTIRNIKYTQNNRYNFNIDDGTGVISVYYTGGLGDVKEGDKVFVKGLVVKGVGQGVYGVQVAEGVDILTYRHHNGELGIISDSISKTRIDADTTKSNGNTPIPKTPGFAAISVITVLLAMTYLLKRR